MRRSLLRTKSGIALAVVGSLLTACGVQIQDAAEPLPSGAIPGLAGTPLQSPSPPSVNRRGLWFAKEGGLVPVTITYPQTITADDVLAALVNGPTPAEIANGMRTIAKEPLTLEPMVSLVSADSAELVPSASRAARVSVGSSFASLPAADQLLLLGQVVLSLSDAGWKRVEFLDESGLQLSVPLPKGGSLLGIAQARDFAALVN